MDLNPFYLSKSKILRSEASAPVPAQISDLSRICRSVAALKERSPSAKTAIYNNPWIAIADSALVGPG